MKTIRFPVGGPRKAVYDYLESRGWAMSAHDKQWYRNDEELRVYGAGSMVMIYRADRSLRYSGPLDDFPD